VQAQGKFSATLIVLLVCAPLNVFLHWLFVWVCIGIQDHWFITNG
jgi:Na+-driven multidrug efflux pump